MVLFKHNGKRLKVWLTKTVTFMCIEFPFRNFSSDTRNCPHQHHCRCKKSEPSKVKFFIRLLVLVCLVVFILCTTGHCTRKTIWNQARWDRNRNTKRCWRKLRHQGLAIPGLRMKEKSSQMKQWNSQVNTCTPQLVSSFSNVLYHNVSSLNF